MNLWFIFRMRPTTCHRAERCGDTRERVCVEMVIMNRSYDVFLVCNHLKLV